jgi:hypothetical protein
MHRLNNMKKTLSLALATLLAAAWMAPAFAQQSLTKIADPAFDNPDSTPVTFNHDAHNAKAGLKDCSLCHHVYNKDGEKQAAASIGTKCSECHHVRPEPTEFAPALMLAFHKRCQNCHMEQKKGPVECAGCHKR